MSSSTSQENVARCKNLWDKFVKDRKSWETSKNQRFIELLNLKDLTKYRYSVENEGNPYGETNPIDECFDPLLLDRSNVDSAVRELKKDCRIRGYTLMGSIGAALGGCYTAFIRASARQPRRLDWVMGVFIGLISVVGGLILIGLINFMNVELETIEKDREIVIEKAAERVSPLAIKIYTVQELDSIVDVEQYYQSLTVFENSDSQKTDSDFRQEDRIIYILEKIMRPLDTHYIKIKVFLEILLSFICGLAVGVRYFLPPFPFPNAPVPSPGIWW